MAAFTCHHPVHGLSGDPAGVAVHGAAVGDAVDAGGHTAVVADVPGDAL